MMHLENFNVIIDGSDYIYTVDNLQYSLYSVNEK